MIYLTALWLLLPAGFANMAPVIAEKLFPNWNTPLDHNRTFRKKVIFGTHKTYRGLVSGTLTGLIIFFFQQRAYAQWPEVRALSLIDYSRLPTIFGAWLGFCALLGDLVKSFFKRRLNIDPGMPWIPFDEIDWIVGALFGISFLFIPGWSLVWGCVAVGVALHFLIRGLAYLMHFVSSPF